VTFVELMERLDVPVRRHGEHHHTTAGYVSVDCPLCSPNWNKFRLGYNLRSGFMSCWSCGGVSRKTFFWHLGRLLPDDKRKELAALAGDITVEDVQPQTGVRGKLVLPAKLGPLGEPHKKFLRRRGFDPDEIAAVWKAQGIGHAPELFWRVFIPIHLGGEVVSWTTRSIKDDARVRYLSAKPDQEKVLHKDLLYGEHLCRKNAVCVVEGPLDAWKGGPGFVSTFGLAFRPAQVLRIAKFPVRLIWFDAEAQNRAEQLAEELKLLPGDTYVVNSDAKDPGSAPKREIEAVRRMLK
jgi:hypothetical protein